MSDSFATGASNALPPSIERVLARFRMLNREEKMQALLAQARRLEPVPERLAALQDPRFEVPECQTPVRLFAEGSEGRIHYWADVDVRRSPTVAAFLSIVLSAINDQPAEVALSIPTDFVRVTMNSIGLGTREVGLDALVARVKRLARESGAAGD